MDEEKLYELLRKSQDKKGYFLNKDREHTMEIMRGLITNKERYGYMACPCRLASGVREEDKDIICPCVYRKADVAEYGACFCNLYVTKEANDKGLNMIAVPERRPLERMLFK